jgi:hypothetical protein
VMSDKTRSRANVEVRLKHGTLRARGYHCVGSDH